MASNMDGVGTFSMAKALQEHEMLTVLRKHYTIANWEVAVTNGVSLQHLVVSTGTNIIFDKDASDYLTMQQVLSKFPDVNIICIDVANGYLENFVQFVNRVREEYPSKTIIAGNVCTPEMTEELIIGGADIVKIGIGPGCFPPGTTVLTSNGTKPIEQIEIDDLVHTHTGSWKRVNNKFEFNHHRELIKINDSIQCTPGHKFYVVHKNYLEIVNDENLHEYAEWIEAKELDKNWYILEENSP